jgi:hypothetical protein
LLAERGHDGAECARSHFDSKRCTCISKDGESAPNLAYQLVLVGASGSGLVDFKARVTD